MRESPAMPPVPRGTLRRSQRGIGLLSLAVTLVVVGLLVLAGFRLLPLYLNQMKVIGALESVQAQYEGRPTTAGELRSALYKRFDIEMITGLTARNVSIERGNGEYVLRAEYERDVHYLGNLYFLVRFDHQVGVRYAR